MANNDHELIERAERLEAEARRLRASVSPARKAARALIERACRSPEMWATHGVPSDCKLQWLEDEITAAIDAAAVSQ